LLDDLHDGVEDADNSLQTRTAHADKVRKKGGVCWMYCVIVLLIIILVFLLITQGGKHIG
jgi:t-SNARE complex subunit (syntaxin)